jgi:GMP synthase-like glutamine amidotransferase
MKVTFFQHENAMRPGKLREYLVRRYRAEVQVVGIDEPLKSEQQLLESDLFVSLGSPVSVYRTDVEWVAREHRVISAAMQRGTPVLGICFGAQLIAALSGGRVTPIGDSHVGWLQNESAASPMWQGPWFRFHKEHCELPSSAEVLARSRGTVQAFQQANAFGLQFHPEIDVSMVEELLPNMQSEYGLTPEQSERILQDTRLREGAIASAREALFDEVLGRRLTLA